MSTSDTPTRRSAIRTALSTLAFGGIATKTATAAIAPAGVKPALAIGPVPSGIAADELRAVIDQMVEEDAYTAGVGLSIARAWYRAHPEMVTCEQAPALFEWAFQRRGDTLDGGENDFGPLEPGYERRIRVDAIETLKRRVACHGNAKGCMDEPSCLSGARWRNEAYCNR